jgi:hypothetical protein
LSGGLIGGVISICALAPVVAFVGLLSVSLRDRMSDIGDVASQAIIGSMQIGIVIRFSGGTQQRASTTTRFQENGSANSDSWEERSSLQKSCIRSRSPGLLEKMM